MYEGAVQDLIDELGRLPGIGPKSAQRIAFHLLQADAADVQRLSTVLVQVKERVTFCEICGNVAQDSTCRMCADPRRDDRSLCVVEEVSDLWALDKSRLFPGKYHVLGGRLSALEGIRPQDLAIDALVARVAATADRDRIDGDNADLIAGLRISPEGQEGLTAFLDKRKPNWMSA